MQEILKRLKQKSLGCICDQHLHDCCRCHSTWSTLGRSFFAELCRALGCHAQTVPGDFSSLLAVQAEQVRGASKWHGPGQGVSCKQGDPLAQMAGQRRAAWRRCMQVSATWHR